MEEVIRIGLVDNKNQDSNQEESVLKLQLQHKIENGKIISVVTTKK